MAGGMSKAGSALSSHGAVHPYLPRVIGRHLLDAQNGVAPVDGTLVFADVSGFTRLSEHLARRGREGAEHLAEAIGDCFSTLLGVAYANGGSLLKFGGDALLLLFEDEEHAARACRSASGMRRALREVGRIETPAGRTRLRMSVGVHSGVVDLFLVGGSHRELVVTGPAASAAVRMEQSASAGEILVSPSTAALLPAAYLGAPRGPGRLLARLPPGTDHAPVEPAIEPAEDQLVACLSTAVRDHVLAGGQPPEHRPVTVAFLRFGGTDALVAEEGPAAAAAALGDLLALVQAAADDHGVCFLGSDVDADGGKIILTGGAPRVVGDDEERVLLALRRVLDAQSRLQLRAGVHRGSVFAGDVGPPFRRTYTVMGDAVNVAARLMAAAPEGEIYASGPVLERSPTSFATLALPPLTLKGKREPMLAMSVGPPVASTVEHAPYRAALVGRADELTDAEEALAEAKAGAPRLVEIVGEPGIGKSRLAQELLDRRGDAQVLRARCEAYRVSEPYAAWRPVLLSLIGLPDTAPANEVLDRLRRLVASEHPDLIPWLALIAVPFGADAPASLEVEELAPAFVRPRLHEVVLRFVARRLSEPTIVALEECQHLDEASAELLGAAVAGLQDVPCLFLLTSRRGSAIDAPPARVRQVRLEPLNPEDTVKLAMALTERAPLLPHLVRLAAQRSGGNPQFLADLLAAGADGEGLPEGVEAAALAVVDRLAPGDRQLVRRASVLGDGFDEQLLAAVLDGRPPERATWTRLTGLIDRRDGRLWFERAAVREAAYAGLAFQTRRRLHAMAGAHLEHRLGDTAEEEAGMLSLHFSRAGDAARTWRYAHAAAARAMEQAACGEAVVLYQRALDAATGTSAPPRKVAETWEALGGAYERTGQTRQAAHAYSMARRLLADAPAEQGRLLYRHARLAYEAGRPDLASRWVRRGLRLLDASEAQDRAIRRSRAHLLSQHAAIKQRQGRPRAAMRLCEQAIEEAQAAQEPSALAAACSVLDWALQESGRIAEATHSQRALRIRRRLGDVAGEAVVLNNLGVSAYFQGRWSEAVDLYTAAADASRRAGDELNVELGNLNIAELRSDQGRPGEAETILRSALPVWRAGGCELFLALAFRQLGRAAARDGRDEEAMRLLGDALAQIRDLHLEPEEVLTEALIAEGHATAGRASEALTVTERLLGRGEAAARSVPILERVRGYALAQLGQVSAATAALETCAREARSRTEHFELVLALDALDALAACSGEPVDQPRRRERDLLAARMDIVRLPEPAVVCGSRSGDAGRPALAR